MLYFTYFPRSPRRRISTKFGARLRLPDVITCVKFYINLSAFQFLGVKIRHSLLTKPVAVNI